MFGKIKMFIIEYTLLTKSCRL